MSIPKEPRQLMINLMYLVLTALLALNVSAEVMNAFFTLDKSIDTSSDLVEATNTKVLASMETTVSEKTNYKPLLDAAKQAQVVVKEFNDYVDELRTEMVEKAGGLMPDDFKDPKRAGKPKKFKDKEVPTAFFVEGVKGAGGIITSEAVGPVLKKKIQDTRAQLVGIVEGVQKMDIEGTQIKKEDVDGLLDKLSLNIDDKTWQDYKKASWEDFVFGHMPVAACYPVLRKFQNDATNSEATIINFLSSQIGATTIEFDKFEPVASSEKGYVIKGEEYSAEVFLSAFSSQAAEGISMRVNGSPLKIEEGKGQYSVRTSSIGEKEYKVDINVENPFTGKVDTYSKTFKYEVGERSVTVSAEKMNVFYIGVKNPIAVSAAGISSNDLTVNVSGAGASKSKTGKSTFDITVAQPGECRVNVSGGGLKDSKIFRVKRIPDPVARLSTSSGGVMGNGTFKAQGGVGAFLDNFDFDATCQIQGFNLVHVAKRQDPVESNNGGARYNAKSKRLVSRAKPGDIYYFDNVKAKCPGDKNGRPINSMVFKIK
jgi:gliding motility-associated protein GldM